MTSAQASVSFFLQKKSPCGKLDSGDCFDVYIAFAQSIEHSLFGSLTVKKCFPEFLVSLSTLCVLKKIGQAVRRTELPAIRYPV